MIKEDTMEKIKGLMEFLQKFIGEKGFPPSVREICEAMNIKSTATAHYYIDKAEKLGYIAKTASKNRTIELRPPYNNFAGNNSETTDKNVVSIPIVGKVAAGLPITAVENIEDNYSFTRGLFSSGELFILTVSGNSMIDVGIYDGDMAVIKKQDICDNGDIIVARVDDEVTLKRFYKESDCIRLHPENSSMKDIVVTPDQSFSIEGILTGIIRLY